MLLYTNVDISDFIMLILDQFFSVIENAVLVLDSVIILDLSDFGVWGDYVTLLDFSIALVVVSIVIGAFVHVNKADNFYSNRKD